MKRKKLIRNEVIKIFNTTRDTIRHYEEKGLISPTVNQSNYHLYDYKEVNKLSQIFFLKELNFSLAEIKKIMELKDPVFYLEVLKNKKKDVDKKIAYYQKLSTKTSDIIKMFTELDKNLLNIEKKSFPQRQFYYFEFDNSNEQENNLKAFYDKFKTFFEDRKYSENKFVLKYKLSCLKDENFSDSKFCCQVNNSNGIDKSALELTAAGDFLCVNYLYNTEDWNSVIKVYNKILNYTRENNLKIINQDILEIKLGEFDMFFPENLAVYQLQIPVK